MMIKMQYVPLIMKIYVVVFFGVLIILFAVFCFFAIGAQNQEWGSVAIGAVVGCLFALLVSRK